MKRNILLPSQTNKGKLVKENQQDGTILVIDLNDLKMTFRVIRKTLIKFYL